MSATVSEHNCAALILLLILSRLNSKIHFAILFDILMENFFICGVFE